MIDGFGRSIDYLGILQTGLATCAASTVMPPEGSGEDGP